MLGAQDSKNPVPARRIVERKRAGRSVFALLIAICASCLVIFGTATPAWGASPCGGPTSGLVSCWPGNGNTNDVVGGNNGTWVGMPAYGPGPAGGQAFQFDGSSSYVEIGDPPSLRLASALTLDAWVNPSDLSGSLRAVITKWAGTNDRDAYGLWIIGQDGWPCGGSGEVLGAIGVFGVNQCGFAGGSVPANQWTNVGITYDAATSAFNIYVNGALAASEQLSGGITASNMSVRIGAAYNSASSLFSGLIGDVSVYNRALSPQEMASFNSTSSGGGGPSAVTLAATNISSASATLNGTVNPHGTGTSYYFQWGPDTNYAYSGPIGPTYVSGTTDVAVSLSATGLLGHTTYHYRLVATNANGTAYGADQTFTTKPPGATILRTFTNSTHTTGTIWYWAGDSEPEGFVVEPYVWAYNLDLTVEAQAAEINPRPSGDPPFYWIFPRIEASMLIPGGAHDYGIKMVPSVGAYVLQNALGLSCAGTTRRYDVPLFPVSISYDSAVATAYAAQGTLAAGFYAPEVVATGTAAAADWAVDTGAITGVATPAALQYSDPCPSTSTARLGAQSAVAIPAPTLRTEPKPKTTFGLRHPRRGGFCGKALSVRFCTPKPPSVTVAGKHIPAAGVAWALIVASRRDHLALGSRYDMAAAVAKVVADSIMSKVAAARGLTPTRTAARNLALKVVQAARADPAGALAAGIRLRGRALERFLLSPRQLDGYRALQGRDHLWYEITGGTTNGQARTRLLGWIVSHARHLRVSVRGLHGFSLKAALALDY